MAEYKPSKESKNNHVNTPKIVVQTRSQFEHDIEDQSPESNRDITVPPTAEAILGLQRTYGNRYVQAVVEQKENIEGEKSDSVVISQAYYMRGRGDKLPVGLQQKGENMLGVNLEGVRVHADPTADRLVSQAGALAFTVGQDIFIWESIKARDNGESDILAHEMVHTVQQKYGSGTDPEYEAENIGRKILSGESVDLYPGQKNPVPVLQKTGAGKGVINIIPPTFSNFQVTGTLTQVERALNARREWGHCEYRFVEAAYGDSNGTITRCDVTVSNAIQLPQWTGDGYTKAPPAAKAEWKRMLGCLKTHELNHAHKAGADAPTFRDNFIGKNNADTQALHNAEIARHKADIQDAYDSDTSNGQDEGVNLDLTTDPRTSLSEGGFEETTGPESE